MRGAALITAFLAVLLASAPGQVRGGATRAGGAPGDPDVSVRNGRVTVRAENVSAHRLVQAIGGALSARLELETPPQGSLTVCFTDLSPADAVRRIMPGAGVVTVYGARGEVLVIKVSSDRGRSMAELRPRGLTGSPPPAGAQPTRVVQHLRDGVEADDALVRSLSNPADDAAEWTEAVAPVEDD